jgi:hypothetical protein
VDGSRAAAWPGKTIYSKVATVGLDPHRKGPDPWMHRPDFLAGFKTSTSANQTPRMGPEPLRRGSGPLSVEPRDAKEKNTQALVKARQGSGADTCSDQVADAPTPRSGGGPMLPRDISPAT